MRKIITVVLLVAVCVLSCKEDNVETPKARPGTMIMKLNGVSVPPSPYLTGIADLSGDGIEIRAEFQRENNGAPYENSIIFLWLDKAAVGRFEIKGNCPQDTKPGNVYYRIEPSVFVYESWLVEESVIGNITITKLDHINQLASGTFELKLKDLNGPDVIELTEGSFTDLPLF
jgi:hypothetical protein